MVEYDSLDRVIGFKRGERFDDAESHINGQRVDGRWPIQPDTTDLAVCRDDNVWSHLTLDRRGRSGC